MYKVDEVNFFYWQFLGMCLLGRLPPTKSHAYEYTRLGQYKQRCLLRIHWGRLHEIVCDRLGRSDLNVHLPNVEKQCVWAEYTYFELSLN